MTYIGTKKTVAYGNSTYVVLDKNWGIRPGQMIRIAVDVLDDDRGSEAEEGH